MTANVTGKLVVANAAPVLESPAQFRPAGRRRSRCDDQQRGGPAAVEGPITVNPELARSHGDIPFLGPSNSSLDLSTRSIAADCSLRPPER